MKDYNFWCGSDWEIFEYLEEVDEVLGCKLNIILKCVFECGLVVDDISVKMGDGEDLLNVGLLIYESDED